jgi:acyl carrier protein
MSVTREELLEEMRAYLLESRQLDPGDVQEHARLREDLDLDSLELAGLALEWEERHGTRLADEDVVRVRTVADALDLIAGGVGAR